MMRIPWWGGAVVCLGLGCASSSMDLGPDHPGSPAATAAPVVEPSAVLVEEPPAPGAESEQQPADEESPHDHGHGGH